MTWNKRVLAKRFDCGTVELEVYDVYYDEEGIANGRSADPSTLFSGDGTIEWLREELRHMAEALDKPIIDIDNFPQEFVE